MEALRAHRAAVAAVVVVATAVGLWKGQSYWNFSDGVYAYSARELLAGRELYGDLVAAQPPPVYWLGAAVLALADELWSLRAALGLLSALTALLIAVATLRLTGSRAAAAATAAASLLTPWALKGSYAWIPEALAAPLLLGAALRGGAVAGALAAVAAATKLAFLLPAAALVLAARDRARFLAGMALAGGLVAAVSLALYGGEIWDAVVTAQRQSGSRAPGDAAKLVAEAAWNSGPILLAAAAAWRARVLDEPLRRTLTFAAAGAALTVATVVKEGAYYTVLTVVEPLALPLAAAGVLWAWRAGAARWAAVALGAFLAAQSLSVLASPEDPAPFKSPGGVRILSSAEVSDAASAARRCGEAPFSGAPFVAFVAERRMPAGQPDLFILRSRVHDAARRAAEADGPRCPG